MKHHKGHPFLIRFLIAKEVRAWEGMGYNHPNNQPSTYFRTSWYPPISLLFSCQVFCRLADHPCFPNLYKNAITLQLQSFCQWEVRGRAVRFHPPGLCLFLASFSHIVKCSPTAYFSCLLKPIPLLRKEPPPLFSLSLFFLFSLFFKNFLFNFRFRKNKIEFDWFFPLCVSYRRLGDYCLLDISSFTAPPSTSMSGGWTYFFTLASSMTPTHTPSPSPPHRLCVPRDGQPPAPCQPSPGLVAMD